MKNLVAFTVLLLMSTVVFSQDQGTVDVAKTKSEINQLKVRNENHQYYIDLNTERYAFLEGRIGENQTRLSEIADSIEYAESINKELLEIKTETEDQKAIAKLEASRSELLSVRWLLKNERADLRHQVTKDQEEMAAISEDTDRRNRLMDENRKTIAQKEKAITSTESQIDQMQNKLSDLKSRLTQLRASVTAN